MTTQTLCKTGFSRFKVARMSIVLVCFFASVLAVQAQIVDDGLVSYYTLDENDIDDGVVKDVFGENDGTIVGEPTQIEGHLGEGLQFAGGPACVELPIGILAIGENSVTYEMWFNKPAESCVGWQYLLTNKTDFHNNFFRLGFNDNSGQIRFYTEHENEARNAFVTDDSYGDGEWHHVAAVRNGAQGLIYVDGTVVKEDAAMDGDIGGDETNWYIAQDGNTNGYLIGSVDEVRIYSRALTSAEIQQNMDAEGLAVDVYDKLSSTWGKIKSVVE